MSKLAIIAAGGTGGHVYPALAFATEMARRGWRPALVTDARGRRYIGEFPAFWTLEVRAASLSPRRPLTSCIGLRDIAAGSIACARRFRREKPALVVGFGGYPSFPCLLAASLAGIPLLLHEQNTLLGRVNRLFARRAAAVASGFDRLERCPRHIRLHVVTGTPVRPDIAALHGQAYPSLAGDLHLLVIGGSQGSARLDDLIPRAISALPVSVRKKLCLTQQVRRDQIETVTALYRAAGIRAELAPFFSDIPSILRRVHLVLARSGASTLAEVTLAGRPSILFPLPGAADDHQSMNADYLVRAGAADLFPETGTPEALTSLLVRRLGDSLDLRLRADKAGFLGRPDAHIGLADLAERIGTNMPTDVPICGKDV